MNLFFNYLAINLLVGLLAVERDCVPAILGLPFIEYIEVHSLALAVAHLFLKQTPKARNQLKRVAKLQFNAIEADAFEGSWLTLAHVYFQVFFLHVSTHESSLVSTVKQLSSARNVWSTTRAVERFEMKCRRIYRLGS